VPCLLGCFSSICIKGRCISEGTVQDDCLCSSFHTLHHLQKPHTEAVTILLMHDSVKSQPAMCAPTNQKGVSMQTCSLHCSRVGIRPESCAYVRHQRRDRLQEAWCEGLHTELLRLNTYHGASHCAREPSYQTDTDMGTLWSLGNVAHDVCGTRV
jgi:hypothetical protein